MGGRIGADLRSPGNNREQPGTTLVGRSEGWCDHFAYVSNGIKLTYMEKTQVYLRQEELDALREVAARSGCSVAELICDAIRKVVLRPKSIGPVALWDGEPKRTSVEHDSAHDEP